MGWKKVCICRRHVQGLDQLLVRSAERVVEERRKKGANEPDRLSILSLASLKILQEDIVSISAQASAQLAWQLQLKDAQTQDSAT